MSAPDDAEECEDNACTGCAWRDAHGITVEPDDDACTCVTGGAYLCLRCERIAENQDIGF